MTFHYIKALNRLQEAAYKQIAESMEYLLLLTAEGTCLFIIDSKKKWTQSKQAKRFQLKAMILFWTLVTSSYFFLPGQCSRVSKLNV